MTPGQHCKGRCHRLTFLLESRRYIILFVGRNRLDYHRRHQLRPRPWSCYTNKQTNPVMNKQVRTSSKHVHIKKPSTVSTEWLYKSNTTNQNLVSSYDKDAEARNSSLPTWWIFLEGFWNNKNSRIRCIFGKAYFNIVSHVKTHKGSTARLVQKSLRRNICLPLHQSWDV